MDTDDHKTMTTPFFSQVPQNSLYVNLKNLTKLTKANTFGLDMSTYHYEIRIGSKKIKRPIIIHVDVVDPFYSLILSNACDHTVDVVVIFVLVIKHIKILGPYYTRRIYEDMGATTLGGVANALMNSRHPGCQLSNTLRLTVLFFVSHVPYNSLYVISKNLTKPTKANTISLHVPTDQYDIRIGSKKIKRPLICHIHAMNNFHTFTTGNACNNATSVLVVNKVFHQ